MTTTEQQRHVFTFHSNRPRRPDPERPAIVVSRRVLVLGLQGVPPIEEAEIVCDDGQRRTFVSGPEGRWVRRT